MVVRAGDAGYGEESGKGRPQSREKLEANLTNIYAALEWSFIHQPVTAVRIVERITTFLGDTGRKFEQIDFCERALAHARKQNMRVSIIGLLARLGWNYTVNGDYSIAEKHLSEAKRLIESHTFVGEIASDVYLRHIQVLRDLGHLYARQGFYSQSLELIHSSGSMAQKLYDALPKLQAEVFHAWTLCLQGQNTAELEPLILAKVILERNLVALKDHPRQLSLALRLLGEIAFAERRYENAFEYLAQASSICEQRYFKAPEYIALMITWGDYHKQAKGDLERAVVCYRIAREYALRWDMVQEARRAQRLLTATFADSSFPTIHAQPKIPLSLKYNYNSDIISYSEITPTHNLASYAMNVEWRESIEPNPKQPQIDSTRRLLHAFLSNFEQLGEEDKRQLILEASEALSIANDGTSEPLPEETQAAITAVIDEIKNKPRGIHEDTKFESALKLFLANGVEGVEVGDLRSYFGVNEDDKKGKESLVLVVTRLSKKLEKYHHTVSRRCFYQITPIENPPTRSE
ncbi:MAG: hypothetical protein IPK17_30745 [Chloroflexi bacterium]|uniref:hypothetical protein n=1 Tax=Candidatus Flexifilum breve TaxID=3140694 RepID=UPI0031359A13|nr:hypothetical protein [Chloroflexota bacterium]